MPECLKPRWPGSILCCRSSDDHTTQEELLLLLLVPETPTWGIGKEQLRQAVCLVNQHRKVHPKRYTEPWEKPIRVVGPMYSGSFTSLSHALGPLPPRPQGSPPEFVIYNGMRRLASTRHVREGVS